MDCVSLATDAEETVCSSRYLAHSRCSSDRGRVSEWAWRQVPPESTSQAVLLPHRHQWGGAALFLGVYTPCMHCVTTYLASLHPGRGESIPFQSWDECSPPSLCPPCWEPGSTGQPWVENWESFWPVLVLAWPVAPLRTLGPSSL